MTLRTARIFFLRSETGMGFGDCARAVDFGGDDAQAVFSHLSKIRRTGFPQDSTYWLWEYDAESSARIRLRILTNYPQAGD